MQTKLTLSRNVPYSLLFTSVNPCCGLQSLIEYTIHAGIIFLKWLEISIPENTVI